ncbi:TetR/AcrR family transcriptional regulator C-terminal domain-containing protein [Nocardiopsis changdeensis]|uniref:TetR/AcrR family transcriptional regulator C-terminal domain-containing protein n=1 Tax=Nocardiopsis changdeensis TaxID=2831969 RepID=A0ABX8BQK2_9ACTN|nr:MULTISPECIES: TetR/AcrR family transcriptional regulator C-terminal domain-containing protein [Nocardiopsis]QUX24500.1 TetR/AcrR family transcriptional regulator C-terminal domain-containing protein [Nocardiopsis changdeensis]QYX34891.1 TetR/AcrR family transcriptional regulator C-terminal domain-containing protein [Nocardiopsis sp. MT53]
MPEQETDPALVIPKALLSAWGAHPVSRKGPRPSLTVGRIVEVAVGLGDRHGPGAITMSRTAAELGVGTMSLYRYVESRADLLLLAVDAALGSPPPPAGATWRERTAELARGLRRVYRAHPWAAEVPVTAEPLAPSFVRWTEEGLAALEETGLDVSDRAQILILLWTYARAEGELAGDQARVRASEEMDAATAHRAFGHRLRTLVPEDAFPRVRELLAADLLSPERAARADDPAQDEAEFDLAVGLILDGVAARAARRGD